MPKNTLGLLCVFAQSLKPVIKDYFGEVADKFYVQFSRSQDSDFYVLTDVKNQMFIIGEDRRYVDDFKTLDVEV